MTTDNRTNEPTEAQVKLAYLAHLKAPRTRGMDVYGPMRAALVAAHGAAPQAESAPTSKYISPNLPGMIRNLWKSDPSENSVRTALRLAGDLIQELIDLKASPVLPSSTVDEDALAEVLVTELMTDWAVEEWPADKVMNTGKRLANTVAEWLKGQGR